LSPGRFPNISIAIEIKVPLQRLQVLDSAHKHLIQYSYIKLNSEVQEYMYQCPVSYIFNCLYQAIHRQTCPLSDASSCRVYHRHHHCAYASWVTCEVTCGARTTCEMRTCVVTCVTTTCETTTCVVTCVKRRTKICGATCVKRRTKTCGACPYVCVYYCSTSEGVGL